MSYTTYDFSESLSRAGIEPTSVETVLAAWGHGSGAGDDAGHFKWAQDGASDWSGGFLMRLRVGGLVYVTGWCDYTGWGCQDGAAVQRFETAPTFTQLRDGSEYHSEPPDDQWDVEPADLNKWLADGAKDPFYA